MQSNISFDKSNVNSPFLLEDIYPLEWHMSRNDKFCFITLLEKIKPTLAIEIGTYKGGSLQVLSHFSKKVYSIDILPEVKELSNHFKNVEFLTGQSQQLVPSLLSNNEVQSNLEFVLIDGDHSSNGVKNDINHFLNFIPQKPLYIIFHDSFNPTCRKGIKASRFNSCKYVHYVELDYVGGVFNPNNLYREMWGGLALVIMLPYQRTKELVINESQKKHFSITYLHSIHLLKDSFFYLFLRELKNYFLKK